MSQSMEERIQAPATTTSVNRYNDDFIFLFIEILQTDVLLCHQVASLKLRKSMKLVCLFSLPFSTKLGQ